LFSFSRFCDLFLAQVFALAKKCRKIRATAFSFYCRCCDLFLAQVFALAKKCKKIRATAFYFLVH
jgi:hypothetical protein